MEGLDSADNQKQKKYSILKTRVYVFVAFLTLILLIIFQYTLSNPLSNVVQNVFSNFYTACFIYTSLFLAFMFAATLPLRFVSSFCIEHRFGLSRQSFGAWALDEGKSALLSFVILAVAAEVFYVVLRNFPATWWIIFAGIWIFFSIIMVRFLPVLVIPLFYKYVPLGDNPLRARIMELAERANVKLMDVCQIDFSRKTSKANAALVGLGKTRKVLLADTLISNFSENETVAVVAHEFGHFALRHMLKLLLFSGIAIISGFFILSCLTDKIVLISGRGSISDLYFLPVFVLFMFIFGIVLMPVQNFFSRVLERQADKFALKLTSNAADFISVMNKLADLNLADRNPSKLKKIFLYDHPPINERINMARGWKRGA
ncbi:MAG: M48 family metallopeptidase [Candidatus Omnitrophica bacterium]|nr:M48 family metallopeptidase [Candidatus Omnitrophota bacterium]